MAQDNREFLLRHIQRERDRAGENTFKFNEDAGSTSPAFRIEHSGSTIEAEFRHTHLSRISWNLENVEEGLRQLKGDLERILLGNHLRSSSSSVLANAVSEVQREAASRLHSYIVSLLDQLN